MSLQTWKAEFYPTEAKDVSVEAALDHSILKWRGLQEDALKRHGATPYNYGFEGEVRFDCGGTFKTNVDSCALCIYHARNQADKACASCPLAKAREGVPCDECHDAEDHGPWTQWCDGDDAKPMLAWLNYTKRKVLGEAETPETKAEMVAAGVDVDFMLEWAEPEPGSDSEGGEL
jgi:hypothetical protein